MCTFVCTFVLADGQRVASLNVGTLGQQKREKRTKCIEEIKELNAKDIQGGVAATKKERQQETSQTHRLRKKPHERERKSEDPNILWNK